MNNRYRVESISVHCMALAFLLVLSPTARSEDIAEHLNARLLTGGLIDVPCVPVHNLRPVQRGFDDIEYSLLPGAHRMVLANSDQGWRMVGGMPQLLVFVQAGFFSMEETTFTNREGERYPAREFRLTPKGYEQMVRSGNPCFQHVTVESVEVLSTEEVMVPQNLASFGKAYRVQFKVRFMSAPWTDNPEYRYVFGGDRHSLRLLRMHTKTFFYSRGRWYDENEALQQLALDTVRVTRGEVHGGQALLGETDDKRASRIKMLRVDALRAALRDDKYRSQLRPCFHISPLGADVSRGLWSGNGVPTLVFYDNTPRRDPTRYENALELVRRLKSVGLAREERFDGEPFPKARSGVGTRYVLDDKVSGALDLKRQACLPLADGEIQSLRIITPASRQGIAFRGWVRAVNPRPWTEKLARRFPNVKAIMQHGYGVSGLVKFDETGEITQLQTDVPRFALKSEERQPARLSSPAPTDGVAATVEYVPGPVRMVPMGCAVSQDGATVYKAENAGCLSARASLGFRRGKGYAEITFKGKSAEATPDTWTNAAVTSTRSLGSVSTGSALFSFTRGQNKYGIKDGDVIGIALDMDEKVLYWHLNGEWRTGRPGSGLGEPLAYDGTERFIAVSVQSESEAWIVNFGAKPFKFPAPKGFPAYGARR